MFGSTLRRANFHKEKVEVETGNIPGWKYFLGLGPIHSILNRFKTPTNLSRKKNTSFCPKESETINRGSPIIVQGLANTAMIGNNIAPELFSRTSKKVLFSIIWVHPVI